MILNEDSKPGFGHKKHVALTKPQLGAFGRNEWAILGAPCNVIKMLSGQIIEALSSRYKCAYVDTTHNDEAAELPGRPQNSAALSYTNQVNYQQLNYKEPFNAFKLRETFAWADLVIANGNHHQAKAQILIIDETKQASLQKRLAQLTNVQLILLADNATDVSEVIKEAVPNWADIPLYRLNEVEKIIAFFEQKLQQAKPRLNGLVLAGGKSERMGFDKGLVNWHGKEQRYYMADMLQHYCNEVFISCRVDQQDIMNEDYKGLPDTFTGLGPYGAILSAFRERPDHAWLVIASDLPLLGDKTLRYLIANRDTAAVATAFKSSFDGFPEPLITIWEPKSYPVLLSFLSQGYSCPRKVLINSDITLLDAPAADELTNVNTPEEFERIKQTLHQKVNAG